MDQTFLRQFAMAILYLLCLIYLFVYLKHNNLPMKSGYRDNYNIDLKEAFDITSHAVLLKLYTIGFLKHTVIWLSLQHIFSV